MPHNPLISPILVLPLQRRAEALRRPQSGRGGGECSVAEHNQGKNGQEPLTERERELIQTLASEIIKEAGLLQSNSEKEAARVKAGAA